MNAMMMSLPLLGLSLILSGSAIQAADTTSSKLQIHVRRVFD
jgi:hypothetical protein